MADPFKLSRKVDASVTCNIHTMEHYKLPLTKQRNATLGHPKQWQPCVSPNMDASIAKQRAAKTREHTPFVNSAAYQYGKLPLRVKDSVQLGVTNPIRPEVKQLYRSARRYPNEYNIRDVERKLTRCCCRHLFLRFWGIWTDWVSKRYAHLQFRSQALGYQ